MVGARVLRLAMVAAGTVGGVSGAAYGLLNGQSWYARRAIGEPVGVPFRSDGVHLPDGTGPVASPPEGDAPLRLAVLGDSSAAGLGVEAPDELPGVRIARGLAAELERPVDLTTYAIVGSTSRDLAAQVDAALVAPPQLVLVIIGANDVTARLSVAECAALLGAAVARLREAGVGVVAGTCPDLGAIRPIPQPLRSVASSWSLALGRAQRHAVEAAGGGAVPLADLLSPEFLTRPQELFSPDRFHPSAAGYEAAAGLLLPALCSAIGEWQGPPVPQPPVRSSAAEARRPTSRVVARLNRRFGRRQAT
ncbi:SGNH/GDSL hydrolase family protein [Saccharopolyspora gloriosae]|uniref:Lysophospholipase L1-like esterase n=1 Tax=Saccharopolyspora gloriosae TaxID=455344 RepID=A0A840N5M9_9PSEU|nr:SGNH/GDSL hydrolase family protein [Saccharopolyspora gloriosae]MBB5067326.1 lysophospholipase L1-like esterase [Saccharopolyspora gloriosae]